MKLLYDKGADVCFHDPHVTQVDMSGLSSVDLNERLLCDVDCVVITTHHSTFDYDWIVDHALRIVDTRNATRDVAHGREKIFKL